MNKGMKAIVWYGPGDIQLSEVKEPRIEQSTDAVVRITATAICGMDLHFVRGKVPNMVPGTILGHEGVGVVEEVGEEVRNIGVGDRVIIVPTIACGVCAYCRCGYFSQCDRTNPNGSRSGPAYYGGPKESGPFHGLQAEMARIPFANVGLVKVPDEVTDEQALLLTDAFPTGYFGAHIAEIREGNTVAVFGCGPVGQFAIASAKLMGAGRIIAVDSDPLRLELARRQGAEVINFNREEPVEVIVCLTGGIGVDRAIDAVGVDAETVLRRSMEAVDADEAQFEFEQEVLETSFDNGEEIASLRNIEAPSQALRWAVECLAKAGTLSIVGSYPRTLNVFPLGQAITKNLTINAGICNHRRYIPKLLELVQAGIIDPLGMITHVEPLRSAMDVYASLAVHFPGWVKVELDPLG